LEAPPLRRPEWATRFLVLGIRCGTSRGGHHVKIERTGAHDMAALVREPDGEAKLRAFYTALLEEQSAALNEESASSGRLLRSYEVFDMAGLRARHVLQPAVLRFTRMQLQVVARVYAGCTQRVAVINLPRWAAVPIRSILELLPMHVRERVHVFGSDDWEPFLARDLDATSIALLRSSPADLRSWRGDAAGGAAAADNGLRGAAEREAAREAGRARPAAFAPPAKPVRAAPPAAALRASVSSDALALLRRCTSAAHEPRRSSPEGVRRARSWPGRLWGPSTGERRSSVGRYYLKCLPAAKHVHVA